MICPIKNRACPYLCIVNNQPSCGTASGSDTANHLGYIKDLKECPLIKLKSKKRLKPSKVRLKKDKYGREREIWETEK
jgi:hypothetical protein